MRPSFVLLLFLVMGVVACQPIAVNTSVPTSQVSTELPVETATVAVPSATAEPATPTSTALPDNVIRVDTFEQEVYPFVENGKCSLAEAILAANSGEPKDSCAAGVPGESVIELMPGEYHFTQPDGSPPQFEWLTTIVEVGNALPPIVFPLTIQGNGATLIRDAGSPPFRFFELVINSTLTMNEVTLQNGDVGENDWGGAIYVSMASLNLNGVHFVGNRASDGGGIYLTMSTLILTDCEFTENHVYSTGGGVHFDAARGVVSNSRFVGNTTDTHGAALAADSTTLVIEDSLFLKNVNKGTSGGALYMEHVNVLITQSEFYQNQTDWTGGAIYIMNPFLIGASDEEGNPLEELIRSSPDIQAILEAHPSGLFQDAFRENSQIHDSCFANNIIVDPKEINYSSALQARMTNASDNYWGLPNGPSGIGPGFGDGVAREIEFMPFLTEPPAHCDPELSAQVQENHNQ